MSQRRRSLFNQTPPQESADCGLAKRVEEYCNEHIKVIEQAAREEWKSSASTHIQLEPHHKEFLNSLPDIDDYLSVVETFNKKHAVAWEKNKEQILEIQKTTVNFI